MSEKSKKTDLKGQSLLELLQQSIASKTMHKQGQLTDPSILKKLRRAIARCKTQKLKTQ